MKKGGNDNLVSLIDNLSKNEGIIKIILQDDYENYIYKGDLLKLIRNGKMAGLRDISVFEEYLEIDGKKLEKLLSILNRYFGNVESDNSSSGE